MPQSISGEVCDPATGEFWRTRYALAGRRAVRSGRPGLCADGMVGFFGQFAVQGSPATSGPAIAVVRGPAGSVAIVRDESGRIAAALKGMLAEAGFGVTILSWEDLSQRRLLSESLDLLVLADARRLPDSAARAVTALLRLRGKVIAVGAPAFRNLLVKTPRGYVELGADGETIYDLVAKHPIPLKTKAWRPSQPRARPQGHDRASPGGGRGARLCA